MKNDLMSTEDFETMMNGCLEDLQVIKATCEKYNVLGYNDHKNKSINN